MVRKILCLLLSITLAGSLLTGCGQTPREDSDKDALQDSSEEYDFGADRAMGRYMEEKEELPEEMKASGKLVKTKEGLWLFELGSSRNTWFRANGKDEWEAKALPETIRETYTLSYAVSDTGEMAFVSYEQIEGTQVYEYVIRLVRQDGSDEELARYNMPVGDMAYDAEGRLYVLVCGQVHRLDTRTAEDENLFNVSTVAERLTFLGDWLLVVDADRVWIYNLSTSAVEKDDTVLNDFVKENISGMGGTDSNIYQACTFAGQDDVLYLACEKGLFRHVLYGNVMEQIVDGGLSSFGDPSKYIQGMEVTDTEGGQDGFTVLFFGNQLVKFSYHSEVPTVPEHRLSVYSLTESVPLRQMIALFQQKNPDYYVTYEVGLSGVGAANTEDVLKKLNTELMAGEGPDVLVLDGLDKETYRSKGLLLDLSDLIDNLPKESEVLPQVVDAVREKDGIYSIPAGFSIPMAVGEKNFMKKLKTVDDLPKVTQALREAYPEGVIWGSSVPECIMSMVCETDGSKWLEQGELQEQELEKSLEKAEAVYAAELSGVSAEVPGEEKEGEAADYPNYGVRDRAIFRHYMLHSTTVGILLKEQKAAMGYVKTPFDLCWIDQLPENYMLTALADSEGIGFKPHLQLSVNSASKETEKAKELVALILSPEGQRMNGTEWAPVNKTAFEESLVNDEDIWLGMGGEDAEGKTVELHASWPGKDTVKIYQAAVKKMNHMLPGNQYLADAVAEVGGKGLKNGEDTGEIADDIRKKTAIYLAE